MMVTRGLHAAAAGMRLQITRQDVHAHNLANTATPGFRRSDLTVGQSSFGRALWDASARPVAQSTAVDVSPGPVRETGSAYDVAIDGDGLFALQTDRGLRFTRDGRLQRTADGALTSISGHPVMGRAGPIVLAADEFLVSDRGQVFSGGVSSMSCSSPDSTAATASGGSPTACWWPSWARGSSLSRVSVRATWRRRT
ncbi:MAG: flagellar hook-basal body complex protein [Armatimonadota bacterium]|jgi:flagellar hook-basal body protein